MLDTPLDTFYTWTALSVAATVLIGTVAGLPMTPVPDASGVADAIDTVTVADYDATAEHDLDADAACIGPHRIGSRNDGGAAHTTFGFGPVTPVIPGSRLGSVARGTPPSAVFDTAAGFDAAAETARDRDASWQPASELLVVRHISWEGTDVTVVSAWSTSLARRRAHHVARRLRGDFGLRDSVRRVDADCRP